MTVHWSEGDHHGLVWPHALALVSGSVPTAAARRLWAEFGPDDDLSGFLTLLSKGSGVHVLSLPDFAIAIRTGSGWQLAARGVLDVTVDDRETVRGAGVSTWAERRLESGDRVVVGASGTPAGDQRPLVAGLVPAGVLVWGAVEVPDAVEGAAASPLVKPLPVPSPEPASLVDPLPEELPPEQEAAFPLPEEASDALAPEAEGPNGAGVTPSGEETRVHLDADEFPEDGLVDDESVGNVALQAQTPADKAPDDEAPEGEESESLSQPGEAAAESAPVGTPTGRFARQYGDTQLWSVEDAAVRPGPAETGGLIAVPDSASGLPDAGELGDHDGVTMMMSPMVKAPTAAVGPDDPGAGPTVLAVACAQGHPNPPHRPACSECGGDVVGMPQRVARPSLGRLVLPSGELIELTAPVIVGRTPRADRVQGPVLPRLVPLSQKHISGSHLELRLEEWNVLAVDLHSTNGTFLRRTGEAPVRLGERPELLVQGDVLDLGHGVQLTLEFLR